MEVLNFKKEERKTTQETIDSYLEKLSNPTASNTVVVLAVADEEDGSMQVFSNRLPVNIIGYLEVVKQILLDRE